MLSCAFFMFINKFKLFINVTERFINLMIKESAMLDYILVLIGVVGLIFASICDIKTREVPDWLNYSLIISGLSLRGIYSLNLWDFSYFLDGLIGFGLFFLLGVALYYSKQWGGGDAKLLMGIGALFGGYPLSLLDYFNPYLDFNFLVILILNLIVVGALYGTLWGVVLVLKNFKEFLKEFKKVEKDLRGILYLDLFIVLLILLFVDELKWFFALLIFSVVLLIYLMVGLKIVEKISFIKVIPTTKLTEGDWIVDDVFYGGKRIYSSKSPGVTKKQISLIKKVKDRVKIKEGVPFVPGIAISVFVSLVFGNLIMYLV